MKKYTFLPLFFVLLITFSFPTFASTEVFSSKDGSTQVFFDENGDVQYRIPGMNVLQTIEADVYGDALIDVSADGKWLTFHKNNNIFLLNLLTKEFNQISLNLDPHWNWLYLKVRFSPNSDYLFTEIERDGIGGFGVCTYNVNSIDFSLVQSQVNQFNESEGFIKLNEQCHSVSSELNKLIEDGKMLPIVDSGSVFDVYDANWNQDNSLLFSTSLFDGEQKWKISADRNEVVQLEGRSLTTTPFSDMTMDDPDMKEILRAMRDGWLQGYPDGTVKLDTPINRAEFTKVVIQALGIPEQSPENQTICPDVPNNEWYFTVFHTAKQKGAIQGYPKNGVPQDQWLCKPDQTINKVEALKVAMELARWNEKAFVESTYAQQYNDTPNSEWYSLYTAFSKDQNLIRSEDGNLHPSAAITRRDMIYMMNHLLDIFGKWQEDF